MIKHTYKMLALNIFWIFYIQSDPTNQIPGLLVPQYANTIRATDFQSGPVVITKSGYYVLSQDISFNPTTNQNNNGKSWDAAIIILADCVTLDLNTHGIGQSHLYNSSNFKIIQLGGFNVYNAQDTIEYTPKHVTIKNGCLHESESYGIYGKNNAHLQIYDLNIYSCNKAGIFLQSAQCSKIEHINITGSSNANGNAYGIFLRDNALVPEWTSNSSGTQKSSSIILNDIKICDITTTNSDNITTLITDLLNCAKDKLDTSKLSSLLNCPSGSFSTGIYSLANTLSSTIDNLKMAIMMAISCLPVNKIPDVLLAKNAVQTAINNLLNAINALSNPTPLDLALKAEVEKINTCLITVCNLLDQASNIINNSNQDYINGSAITTAWNVYGIRITNAQGIELHNCSVTGTNTPNPEVATEYAIGIALDKCFSCILNNCIVNNSSVDNGSAIGFSIATSSESNHITNCTSSHHTSNDKAYGYWLCQSHSNNFLNCKSSASTGRTESKGFYLERCKANHLNNCSAHYQSCTLISAGEPAETIGFDSVGGDCNVFDTCTSYNMTADNANLSTSYQANLVALGFRLKQHISSMTNDTHSVITNSTSSCHQGSRGIAAGIMLDGATCSTIRKNTLATNNSNITTNLGNGYGLYDTAADTSALIVENLAYANQTINYKVSYSLSNEQLPVVNSTYGDMTSLYVASLWQNISLHANPGSTGCNAACTPNSEQS